MQGMRKRQGFVKSVAWRLLTPLLSVQLYFDKVQYYKECGYTDADLIHRKAKWHIE
jgi:hypothetical protein